LAQGNGRGYLISQQRRGFCHAPAVFQSHPCRLNPARYNDPILLNEE
jgi:hypothetical protein